MSNTKKIIVIEDKQDLVLNLSQSFKKWSIENYELKWLNTLDLKAEKKVDCVIIDCRLIEDIDTTITELKKMSISNIVFVIDCLNHPMSHKITLMGASIFYKYSPITALLYKIDRVFKCYKDVPDQIDYEKDKAEYKGKMIAVHSPAGGTGKTTICINLAIQYAMKNLKVLLIDYSTFGNLDISLNITERHKGLSNIVAAMEQIGVKGDELDVNSLLHENIVKYSIDSIDIDILQSANPLKIQNIEIKHVENLLGIIKRKDYDVVIIDTASELSERNLAIFEIVNEILITTIPEVSCGWKLIQQRDIFEYVQLTSKCKLLINKYSKKVGYISRELESELQFPLIGIIPENREIIFQNNQGKPIGLNKGHKINGYFRYVAHQLLPIFSEKEIKLKRLFGM